MIEQRGYRHQDDPSPTKPIPVNISRRSERSIDPSTLSILYILLVHHSPEFILRLITSLHESQHTFVIHVDAKVPLLWTGSSSSLRLEFMTGRNLSSSQRFHTSPAAGLWLSRGS